MPKVINVYASMN